MFSILAQNRRRGWQNFEKKNWRGASRDSFFLEILSPLEPILRTKIKNMISPDYVLYPEPMEILGKIENFGKFWKFWFIISKVIWAKYDGERGICFLIFP